MRRLIITDPARSDLIDIRRFTVNRHGPVPADAYDAVLKQALGDIRGHPYRPGSKERSEIGEAIRSYHIALSRDRAESGVKSPRHFVLYVLPHDDEVVISRILHESRELARHIPQDHLRQARDREPWAKERSGDRDRER